MRNLWLWIKKKFFMLKSENISGAEAILLSLIAEGVDTIFGYPGGTIIPIYDKLYGYTDQINHILTRHEQGAVHAAQGYARTTGKVGVCLATSGPGATNLVTGIADAMVDSTPLVCITGQVAAAMLGSDAFQEADIVSMTMPVTKWSFQVTKAEEIPYAISRAFYIAKTGRPGPVVIDFAKNAQIETIEEFEYSPCTSMRAYRPYPEIEMDDITAAAELINSAERPLLVIGQGVKLSGAEEALIALAQKADIPIASTLMGLSAIPTTHPLYMGKLGMHGNIAPNAMTQESDLLIAVGMRFSDRVTGNVATYAPKAKVIHIDVDRSEIGKVVRADVGVAGDAKAVIEAIAPLVEACEREGWLAFGKEKYNEEYEHVIAPILNPKRESLNMGEAVGTVADVFESDAIVVTDVGQQQMFSSRYSKFNSSNSFITSGGLGTMGFGLPAAIGAKIGNPDREVVVFMGDGGFQMTMQEIGTIMQNKIAVKMVILNNNFLGMVRQWQELFFEKRYSFTELENPDFMKIADAYNIPHKRVVSRDQLLDAVKEMKESKESYMLEVVVEPEDNVFPMVPAGASISDLFYKE